MLTRLSAFIFVTLFCFCMAKGQHIYYKNMQRDSLSLFGDTISNIEFVNGKDSFDVTNQLKYLLKFFPKIEFAKIKVIFKPMDIPAKVKPVFGSAFTRQEDRVYKLYLNSGNHSAVDSLSMRKLGLNSQLGLLVRELGQIHDLSTDGFFDLLGWRLKQMRKKSRKKLDHDSDLRMIELGMGYFMLSLIRDEERALRIENWTDVKSYVRYVKHERNEFMGSANVLNYMRDMPIYVTHKYR
jgi:hypothetical protein